MNYKTIFIVIILFLCLELSLITVTSAINANSEFDEQNRTLIIKDKKTSEILMTIQQVSVKPDLVTIEEIFKITSYSDYTFNKKKDFGLRLKRFVGKKDISKIKWEILETVKYNVTVPEFELIEKNLTISNIWSYTNVSDIYDADPWRLDWGVNEKKKWNITNSGGNGTIGFNRYEVISTNPFNVKFFWNLTEQSGNHQEVRYRDEWRPFLPDGKTIKKNEIYTVKLTLYKPAETGKFSIKMIPMFSGIEEERMTWWNGSWNYRIDNPIPDGARPYQISINISNSIGSNNATYVFLNGQSNTNFTDIRFTLDNITDLSYWRENNETGKVWVNVIANGTVNLLYSNPSAIDSSDGKNTFEFFDDFVPESWEKIQKMPYQIADMAGTVLNGKIYTIGGYNLGGSDPRGEVWAYDPVYNSYVQKANLNYARWGNACTDHGNNIYCFGGSPNYITEKYYPDNNTWLALSNPPLDLRDQGLSAVTGGNYVYLFRNSSLFRHDPVDDSYILLDKTPNNVLSWALMAYYNNEIYIIGGYYNGALNDVQIYNITNNAWRSGSSMPVRLYGSLRENPVVNGNIYVLQGQSNWGEFFSRFWVYNIKTDSWGWGELGYWDADGVAGGVIGNKIYTFGGRRVVPGTAGTDFAGVLDTTKVRQAEWIDRVTGNWRVDDSTLTTGLTQYNPVAQLRTLGQASNTDKKIISRIKYLYGSNGYGGLTTQSNGGVYNSDNNGYIDPWIDITVNQDVLKRETGTSFTLLGSNSLASQDVWHTYTSYYDSSSIRSTRDGTDAILASDGTYRDGYIQAIKTSDFNMRVDYIAVERSVTPEPRWAIWGNEASNYGAPNLTSWSNNKTHNNNLNLTVNAGEAINFNATADRMVTTWNWFKDDVNQNNNFNNFTTSWSTAGTKTIKVTASNNNGTSNIVTWTINVNPIPLTFNSKYIVTSSTPISTASDLLVDDTEASQIFSISSPKTAFIIYNAHNENGQNEPREGKQIAINIDGSDSGITWNSPITSNGPNGLTTFWIGKLEAGSHTIKGRFASNAAGSTATVGERVLSIYILNGDGFLYRDSNTESATGSGSFIDDPDANMTFSFSEDAKALILYNVGNSHNTIEAGEGKKIAINLYGTDYSQAEKSPFAVNYADNVLTFHYANLNAATYTARGRFARSGGVSGSVTISRRQFGILLFDKSTLADYITSNVQVGTTSNYPVNDESATINRTITDIRELLVVAMGTKRHGTSSSSYGEAYGIRINSNDRAKSKASPYKMSYSNSMSSAYGGTLTSGSHVVQGRFGNNFGTDTAVIDSRRIVALWLDAGNTPTITSWGNNKTNNTILNLTVNAGEAIKFNTTADQTITTWNWYRDGINQYNNYDNFTTSWSSSGLKTIKVNANNSNGTSNSVIWNVMVKGLLFDQGWQYRKIIEVNNPGENLINYQIGLMIDTQSLIMAGKLNPDGSDLRFVDSDDKTLLPFWNDGQ